MPRKQRTVIIRGPKRGLGSGKEGPEIRITAFLDVPEEKKTPSEEDAEKLYQVLYEAVPSGTVNELTKMLVRWCENEEEGWWREFKREIGWS